MKPSLSDRCEDDDLSMTLLDIPHDEVCEVGEDQCPVRSVVVVQGGPQCPPVLLRLLLRLQVDSQDKHNAPRLDV